MRTDDLDFELPSELIAQVPTASRSASRLLHYERSSRSLAHRQFVELPSLLRAGDLLVFNDAKVTPARFFIRKPTGGRVEGLFLREDDSAGPGHWRALLRNLGPQQPVYALEGAPDLELRVVRRLDEGEFVVAVRSSVPSADLRAQPDLRAEAVLARVGRMPLPPYIRRDRSGLRASSDESPADTGPSNRAAGQHGLASGPEPSRADEPDTAGSSLADEQEQFDRQRYQTVYARESGSVAAPTAGLHFTDEIFAELANRGIERTFVTLHVGIGTFKPVSADTLASHNMHVERYTLPESTVVAINRAKRERRRVIAVGTTSARVLESQPPGEISPCSSETGIFIYPPYAWKHVSALITNFHLPRSTLIALVAALVGIEEQRRIYHEAIDQGYRFFSYGDSSFIE